MSQAPVIKIEGLGKRYRLGEIKPYYALRDTLAGLFRRQPPKPDFWALQEIDLKVFKGETVGIIGANGAGKSTLLKILSRITPPTTGRATIRGRVSSLLEVGTGFNPELTGRENVYLNGAILGMTRKEISDKFEQIVEFAEVSRFIDTPVKRYSSGMQVRLAFAVAAHLEPEILIVDEVLAVGDVAFQKKCLGKMGEAASGGRTVLFVSHNMGAVKQLCERCVWLDGGRVKMVGETVEVVAKYLGENTEAQAVNCYDEDPNKKVQIRKISILDQYCAPSMDIDVTEEFFVEVEYDVREDILMRNYVCLTFSDLHDNILFQSFDVDSNREYYENRMKGTYRVTYNFPANLLNSIAVKLKVSCGVPLKYSHSGGGALLIDERDGIAINLFKGKGFSAEFFGGGRAGGFLVKVDSIITKLS
jgi:lipopolysaccharide transport system ATP-binding protein